MYNRILPKPKGDEAAQLCQLSTPDALAIFVQTPVQQITTDRIRSHHIFFSHTRLIRCLSLRGWVQSMQARIERLPERNT